MMEFSGGIPVLMNRSAKTALGTQNLALHDPCESRHSRRADV